MKRAILLITIVILLLTGCQETPKEPIVVEKNTEDLIKAAAESQEGEIIAATVQEKVNAPSEICYESTQGRLKVVADAKVVVPDTDKIPIINVSSGVFSQETVDRYWNELVGDTPMWEWADQPTKADIEQLIINQRQLLVDAEREINSEEMEAVNRRINELGGMYDTAPQTVDISESTSLLKERVNWDPVFGVIDTRYMGTSGYSVKSQTELAELDDWKFIKVSNPWTGTEGSIASDTSPAEITFETATLENNYFSYGSIVVNEKTELDESVKVLLKTTPKEAIDTVEEFLKDTETPMKIYSVELINDGNEYEGKEAQHYAYKITCARIIDNDLCVVPIHGNMLNMYSEEYIPMESIPSYARPWKHERMIIRLDDDGIFGVTWYSLLDIHDTEVEDSKLLPFSDIQSIFEKMIYITHEPNIQEGYSMTFNISKVCLELVRVRKQNSNQSVLEGLIIPVWNYYGDIELYKSGGDLVGCAEGDHLMLTINAVDGSIIDTNLGY